MKTCKWYIRHVLIISYKTYLDAALGLMSDGNNNNNNNNNKNVTDIYAIITIIIYVMKS